MARDSLAAIESIARLGYGKDLFEGDMQALAVQLLTSDAALCREFHGNAYWLAANLRQLGRETRNIPPAPLAPAAQPAPRSTPLVARAATTPAARAATPATRTHAQDGAPAPLRRPTPEGPALGPRMPLNELRSRAGLPRFDPVGGSAQGATTMRNLVRLFQSVGLDPVALPPFDLTVDRAAAIAWIESFAGNPAELHHRLAV